MIDVIAVLLFVTVALGGLKLWEITRRRPRIRRVRGDRGQRRRRSPRVRTTTAEKIARVATGGTVKWK